MKEYALTIAWSVCLLVCVWTFAARRFLISRKNRTWRMNEWKNTTTKFFFYKFDWNIGWTHGDGTMITIEIEAYLCTFFILCHALHLLSFLRKDSDRRWLAVISVFRRQTKNRSNEQCIYHLEILSELTSHKMVLVGRMYDVRQADFNFGMMQKLVSFEWIKSYMCSQKKKTLNLTADRELKLLIYPLNGII